MKAKEVEKILLKNGFEITNVKKHIKLQKGSIITFLPKSNKELTKGMLKAIEKQTGISFQIKN